MVGVLAQRWMKDERAKKARKEKVPTAEQYYKNLEKKIREATAENIAEMDKNTLERLKMEKGLEAIGKCCENDEASKVKKNSQ